MGADVYRTARPCPACGFYAFAHDIVEGRCATCRGVARTCADCGADLPDDESASPYCRGECAEPRTCVDCDVALPADYLADSCRTCIALQDGEPLPWDDGYPAREVPR